MTVPISEQWRGIDHDLIPTIHRLKRWSTISPDCSITLIDSKPYEGCLQYFKQAFSDPAVIKYLTVSSDFSPEEYITYMNGDIETIIGGSPHNALFHIYSPDYNLGPIGHVSIKDINWNEMSFRRGMVLLSQFHGQQIGSKASYLVLNHMKTIGFKTAYTEVHPENTRSLNLVQNFFGNGELQPDNRVHFKLDLSLPIPNNPFTDKVFDN